MFQRIRRSFRRKKASHCINCGHVNAQCYHKEYENIKDLEQSKADHLKWLDLDYQQPHVAPKPNNLVLQRVRSQRRPHSAVFNDYSNLPAAAAASPAKVSCPDSRDVCRSAVLCAIFLSETALLHCSVMHLDGRIHTFFQC